MSKLPKIGSRVRVPFGRTQVEGTVVDAYDSGFGGQVVVAILFEDAEEPLRTTFSAESVELAA